MGLLNPSGLYFLAILPLLVIAYLARERPRSVIVSSVLAFRALHVMRGERFGGLPRFTWTFFLELMMLALAALALASPYLLNRGTPVAIVLDNSAAMQARITNGQSRFDAALDRLRSVVHDAGSSSITLYLTAPEPHQFGSAALQSKAAASLLNRAKVLDTPADRVATARLLNQLVADRRLGRIVFASSRPIASPTPPRVTSIVVGTPIPNYALGAFTLNRGGFDRPNLQGRVEVANFSQTAQTLKVAIAGDNKSLATASAQFGPGEVKAIEFSNLAAASVYRAHLEPDDGFALDNSAFATASAQRSLTLLFVSPNPADGESLKAIPGLTVTARTPQAYAPQDLATADLVVFEYALPKQLPALNTLFVMPPPGDQTLGFVTIPATELRVTGWPTTDPLTAGVNFRLLTMRSGEYLSDHPWMQAVVHGAEGGLIVEGDREGHRYVATGFNPFPYLGKRNLPMSILTLNLLNHLAGLSAQANGLRTGENWTVPTGIKEIVAPSGERVKAVAGATFRPDEQGIYEMVAADGGHQRAVNLNDLTTSDLENVTPIAIEQAAGIVRSEANPVRKPLAPYVLMAIIGLIALEALFVYRGRHPIEG